MYVIFIIDDDVTLVVLRGKSQNLRGVVERVCRSLYVFVLVLLLSCKANVFPEGCRTGLGPQECPSRDAEAGVDCRGPGI